MGKSHKSQTKASIQADERKRVNRDERKRVKRDLNDGYYENVNFSKKISKQVFDDEK